MSGMNAALYIHFPFCIKKCYYCDFYSVEENAARITAWLNGLKREVSLYASHAIVKDFLFKTLYLGGGTPSILKPAQLEKLLCHVREKFSFDPQIETSMEVNPETVTLNKLKSYRDLGIHRLSIGIQSFDDRELKTLGRIHDAGRAVDCIRMAQDAGFKDIGLDLIFAIPGQTLASWTSNLRRAIESQAQHISIYGLTIERGTSMEDRIRRGELRQLSDELQRAMYLEGIDMLVKNGYLHYEISNFAQPGHESLHNRMYWKGLSYLGLGPSAHSFWNSRRQWNIRDVGMYADRLKQNVLPVENFETLTIEQEMLEFILLNLRQHTGIDLRLFREKFQIDFLKKFENELDRIQSMKEALICFDNDRLRLTPHGFVLYDEILYKFVD